MPAIAKSRWYVVFAYAFVGVVTQMLWMTLMPVTTVAADRFGVSVTAIGWLANIMVAACVVLSIPAGLLLDRHFKGALTVGTVLIAAAAFIRFGGSYQWLLVSYCVAGVGQPLVLTAITGLNRNYVAPKDRPLGIAIATGSQWVGYIGAFALGAVLSSEAQLSTLFMVNAVVALAAAVAVGVALIGPMPFKTVTEKRSIASEIRGVTRAWSDPLLRLLVIYSFVPMGVGIALLTWNEALLKPAGVSVTAASLMLIAYVVAGIVGTILLPVPVARRRKEMAVGMAAIGVTAVVLVTLAIVPGAVVGLVGLTLIGFLSLPMVAIMFEIVERLPGHGEGVAAGWIWAVGDLGGVIVTAIIGFTVGSPGLSYVLLGAISLLALPVVLRLVRPLDALSSTHADRLAADAAELAAAGPTTPAAS